MQDKDEGARAPAETGGPSDDASQGQEKKTPKPTREDRLAEALRANLRRRKSAAKKSKAE